VVVLIGVLAAIALSAYLGQQEKAQDSSAKSQARTLVTYLDSCFTREEDFTKCASKADAEADDVNWGTDPGQVSVTDSKQTSYEVTAVSESGHTFAIEREIGSGMSRSCVGGGGCRGGTW